MAYDSDSTVRNEAYCLSSWQKQNVDSMNKGMGYNNLGDRANASPPPTVVKAASSNPQVGPQAGNGKYDY